MRLRPFALLPLVLVAGCQPSVPVAAPPTVGQTSAAPAPSPSAARVASPSAAPAVPAASPSPVVAPASPAPPAAGASRVETLNAANSAFSRGDMATASGLYERVLNTPPTGEPAEATAAINAFSQFRSIVTLLAQGREDEARTNLDALEKSSPNDPFARLASQLWDQYGMTGSLRAACAQIQPQVAAQAGPALSGLQNLGVGVDPRTVCGVPE